MSGSYGYYTDPVLDWAGKSRHPAQEWLLCTALFALLAGLVGWMAPMAVLALTVWRDWGGTDGMWWRYLLCVAVEVVPLSTWWAVGIWRASRRSQ